MRAGTVRYPVTKQEDAFCTRGDMNKILEKEFITPFVFRMKVEAPEIARKRKAGQFIILRTCDAGERIPLTIADGNADEGWIELVVQVVGKTTKQLPARRSAISRDRSGSRRTSSSSARSSSSAAASASHPRIRSRRR